ncbi:hypothetical protein PMIN03_008284 [Paraphaeosphaeria minitans]
MARRPVTAAMIRGALSPSRRAAPTAYVVRQGTHHRCCRCHGSRDLPGPPRSLPPNFTSVDLQTLQDTQRLDPVLQFGTCGQPLSSLELPASFSVGFRNADLSRARPDWGEPPIRGRMLGGSGTLTRRSVLEVILRFQPSRSSPTQIIVLAQLAEHIAAAVT